MAETGTVNLSLCKPGDECHMRDGEKLVFKSFCETSGWPVCEFSDGSSTFWMMDGRRWNGAPPSEADIIRVTRNGQQITPVVPTEQPAGEKIPGIGYETGRNLNTILEMIEEEKAQPVITRPGKYRTEAYDLDACDERYIADVVGKGLDGRWYGRGNHGPECWNDHGEAHRFPREGDRITGPYVEPPKPVLTITEKARVEIAGEQWVVAEVTNWDGMSSDQIKITIGNMAGGCLFTTRLHLALSASNVFVCRESNWCDVGELVAKVNAEAKVLSGRIH